MPPSSEPQAILVVEDEWLIRSMAVDILEQAGFRVVETSSGEEALKQLEADPRLSALFTDVELTGKLDGFSLARIAHQNRPDMAILVVSGRQVPGEGVLPPGATYIAKPYDSFQVIRTLRGMLGPF